MSLKTKAFIYQLLSFAALFILVRLLVVEFTGLQDFWIPLTAFIVGTILAPQFQVVKTNDGEKMFMKWIFMKGIKQIK